MSFLLPCKVNYIYIVQVELKISKIEYGTEKQGDLLVGRSRGRNTTASLTFRGKSRRH